MAWNQIVVEGDLNEEEVAKRVLPTLLNRLIWCLLTEGSCEVVALTTMGGGTSKDVFPALKAGEQVGFIDERGGCELKAMAKIRKDLTKDNNGATTIMALARTKCLAVSLATAARPQREQSGFDPEF